MFLTKSRNCFCLQGPWYCRKWQYPIAERKEKPLLDAKKDSKAAGALECSGRDESPCITFDNLKAARICRQLGLRFKRNTAIATFQHSCLLIYSINP